MLQIAAWLTLIFNSTKRFFSIYPFKILSALGNLILQILQFIFLLINTFPKISVFVLLAINYFITTQAILFILTQILHIKISCDSQSLIWVGSFIVHLLLFIVNAVKVAKETYRIKKRFPVVNPNNDSIVVLLTLFKIRCFEIAKLYIYIRHLQDKAGKENWREVFLAEHFYCQTETFYYTEKELEALQKQSNLKAEALVNEKFKFPSYLPIEFYQDQLIDFEIAFILENNVLDITKLVAVKTFGVLDNTIISLMQEYVQFNTASSSKFINNNPLCLKIFKNKTIQSYNNINQMWQEIILALRAALVFQKIKNENHINVDQILEEIATLEKLQNSISHIIEQKNSHEKSFLAPSKEMENLITENWQKNPIKDIC